MKRDIKIIPNVLDEKDKVYSVLLNRDYIGSILIDDEDIHIKFVKRINHSIQKEVISIFNRIYM